MEISLNGGVIIIGSLLWDNDIQRLNWRDNSLDLESMISVKVPIRYGRVSSNRNDTFTMVFSHECINSKLTGDAVFVPFRKNPLDFETLINEKTEIIKSERKKNNLDNDRNNWAWGSLGILLNPKVLERISDKREQAMFLLSQWKDKYYSDFKISEYKVGEELPVIDKSGVFQFNWPEGLEEYDFIIATATKPEINEYPDSKNIINRIISNEYSEYFLKNKQNGINTFQDELISEIIK